MTFTVPTREPDRLHVGVTWKWYKDLPAYLPATWTLSYELVQANAKISITATDNGDDRHLISVAMATTADYAPGEYYWQSFVTDGSDRHFLERGVIEIVPDFADAPVDARSHVKTVLDALRAMIEGKATQDQMSVTIGDHTLQHLTPSQINDWLTIYQRRWNLEQNRYRRERGLKPKGRKVKVRFGA